MLFILRGILPDHMTTPPASSIRWRSSVRLGLWSLESGTAEQNTNQQSQYQEPTQDTVHLDGTTHVLVLLPGINKPAKGQQDKYQSLHYKQQEY